MNEISSALKDRIIGHLINNANDLKGSASLKSIADTFNIGPNTVNGLLNYFENRNLMRVDRLIGGNFNYAFTIDGLEFVRMGGFAMYDELLLQNIEKLRLEVEALKHTAPERAETFTTIIANIVTAIKFFCSV
jgi:hypothetical protein